MDARWSTRLPADLSDSRVVVAMLSGQCLSMAAALAEQPGWGRVAILVSRSSHADEVCHAYAVAPSGRWVDVEGAHEPEECLQYWRQTIAGQHRALAYLQALPPGRGLSDLTAAEQHAASAAMSRPVPVTVVTVITDGRGARSLSDRDPDPRLGLARHTPANPVCMPLARRLVSAVIASLPADV